MNQFERLTEQIVEAAVKRAGGYIAWAVIGPHFRKALIESETLYVIAAQDTLRREFVHDLIKYVHEEINRGER